MGPEHRRGRPFTADAIVNRGAVHVSGAAVVNTGSVSGSGALSVAGSAQVNTGHVRQSSLSMSGGTVKITPTGNGAAAGTSVIATVSLSGQAKLDLADNKLITQSALGTATAGTYSGISGLIQSAFVSGVGDWSGPGITTSKANAINTGLETLGSAIAGEVISFDGDTALWGGQIVRATDTIVMYTHTGDANLDGSVDGGDYSFLDAYVGTSDPAYYKGDFNYDGYIDGGDYAYIDITIGATPPFATRPGDANGSASLTAVPEPTALCGLAAAAAPLLSRRRRGRRRA